MPSKNPNNHATRFKPGNTAAKGKKLTELEKAVREGTRQMIAECVNHCNGKTKEQLKKIKDDPKNNAFLVGVANAYLHWYTHGNFDAIDKIFNRILGKSVERVKLGNEDGETLKISFDKSIKGI